MPAPLPSCFVCSISVFLTTVLWLILDEKTRAVRREVAYPKSPDHSLQKRTLCGVSVRLSDIAVSSSQAQAPRLQITFS